MPLWSILVLSEMPRDGITYPDPGNNCILGLMFNHNLSQYLSAFIEGSVPHPVPLKFVFRKNDHGQVVDCIPQVNGFFPPDQLAYRRVGGRGSDPPFELWYFKNQMQLGVQFPESANDTIVSLSCSLELNKLWYGSVVAVMLEKTENLKRYTNLYESLYGLLNPRITDYNYSTVEHDSGVKCISGITVKYFPARLQLSHRENDGKGDACASSLSIMLRYQLLRAI
ncbi:hypothetical protein F5146DRAFT_1002379 [Armillaria mellea]|nr:hypothetical protein F5146DRAFT_1002379 [Armillaria mellea]